MENKELRNKQKQEAIKRLEILQNEYGIHKNVLKEFKQDETIYYSERINKIFNGVLYWIRNRDELVNVIKRVEEQRNVFIYHCLLEHTEFGDRLTMLYISEDEQNWQYERKELLDGFISVCVYDLQFDEFEFGGTQINGVNGGLCRLY